MPWRIAPMRLATVLVTAGVLVTACAGGDDASGDEVTITVLAAASLTESFSEIGAAFEQANPGVRVVFSFGPSSGLVSQVIEGAVADVLATANETTMVSAVERQVVDQPRTFATNALTIAVPASNPAGITDITGLAQPDVLIAVCEPRVPCGSAAQQVMEASGLPIRPVTYEIDVKSVLSKVILDEVDAGMVYATDVIAAGDKVVGVPIPSEYSAGVTYPIAVITESPQPDAAVAFVEFTSSAAAQEIMARLGFGPPG